jgi:riboflavin kinase
MTKTPPQLWTLIELYEQGAARRTLELSTSELASLLGLSQQGVSKHLLQLEKDGLIERKRSGRRTGVLVSRSGADRVLSVYSRLKTAIEGKAGVLDFHGTLFTGLGEGGYYISLAGYKRQFVKLLGFEPFPGTLNLTISHAEIELRKQLNFMEALELSGFSQGGRSYGPAKCFRAKVESKYDAGALIIERTHHGESVLEVISPLDLRKTLSLNDGDPVHVTVYIGDRQPEKQ